jgi:hypothetical protein
MSFRDAGSEPVDDLDIVDRELPALLPDELSSMFRRLGSAEQRVRGRYFLMVYAMGASIDYAWFNAMNREPEHFEAIREIVDGVDDGEIRHALRHRDDPGLPVLEWASAH